MGDFNYVSKIKIKYFPFQQLITTLKSLTVVNLRRNTLFAIDQVDTDLGLAIEELDLSENNLRFLKSNQFRSFNKL